MLSDEAAESRPVSVARTIGNPLLAGRCYGVIAESFLPRSSGSHPIAHEINPLLNLLATHEAWKHAALTSGVG